MITILAKQTRRAYQYSFRAPDDELEHARQVHPSTGQP